MKKRRLLSLLFVGIFLSISGCAMMKQTFALKPVMQIRIQAFEVRGQGTPANVFRSVTQALVDRGYDIKQSNQDAGLITTEFKKYASFGNNPAFDYYLQIRSVVRQENGRSVVVRLTPVIKSQNRLNASAFTEGELEYYIAKRERVCGIRSA